MELGMSMGLAQQMVNTMNQTMNTMNIAGVNAGTTGKACSLSADQPGSKWYAAIDGKLAGPLSVNEIRKLIERNIIIADTLLWCPGMKAWTNADNIPEINKELLLK